MTAREQDVEILHRGRILNLRRARVTLPGGKETTLELMDHPGAAAIVALDGDDVILIRQYRHAAEGRLWEIPGGDAGVRRVARRLRASRVGRGGRRAGGAAETARLHLHRAGIRQREDSYLHRRRAERSAHASGRGRGHRRG